VQLYIVLSIGYFFLVGHVFYKFQMSVLSGSLRSVFTFPIQSWSLFCLLYRSLILYYGMFNECNCILIIWLEDDDSTELSSFRLIILGLRNENVMGRVVCELLSTQFFGPRGMKRYRCLD
jgi:hypothetical protein